MIADIIIGIIIFIAIIALIVYFVIKQLKRYKKAMKMTDQFLNEGRNPFKEMHDATNNNDKNK